MNKNILKYASCACAGILAGGLAYKLKDCPDLHSYDSEFRKEGDIETNNDSIKVNYLGTTSMMISDGKTNLMIDGFVTRPNKFNLFLGKIKTDKNLVKKTLQKLKVEKLDAILVFHSHYDHVMDSPEFARQTGAVVIGSKSTALVCKGDNLPENQTRVVIPGKPMQFGEFKVTFILSKHIKLPWLLEKGGMAEDITKKVIQPTYFLNYKEGGTYSILLEHPKGSLMLHSGDANAGELKGYHADTVFLCTPYLEKMDNNFQKKLFKEVFEETDAKRVIPVHWDDITQPIMKPLKPLSTIATDLDKTMKILKNYTRSRNMTIEMVNSFDNITLFT